jgi:hypothetical protein
MEHKAQFPPITVFYDGIDHWCVDGFHRIAAALKKGETRLNAIIHSGSLLDAQWYSFGVNKSHGLRRTNEDKRKAVEAALEHAKGEKLSDRAIGDHCGVSYRMVEEIRKSLVSTGKLSQSNTRVGKDGRTYDISKTQEANKKRATKTTTSETTTNKTVVEAPTEAEFVEEHEEPKTAYVLEGDDALDIVKDKLGRIVPEQYAPAFQLLPPVINAIRQHFIQAQKVWMTRWSHGYGPTWCHVTQRAT